ncbi:hypothetical protein, partial [Streptomyces roseolilacinus]|uniref:hypothetical protein n=1 Tax=Streptomyces roseolilacinus TaxID=66904 RepID=UPI001676A11E
TRTSNVNHRPPVITSKLKVTELDLTPGKEHLVCPDCSTWVPITGMLGTPKLVPHHTGRAKAAEPRRCTAGSNRRIDLDIKLDAWRVGVAERAEVAATVAFRRATKVLPKPRTGSVPAVSQLKPTPLTPEAVRVVFIRHREMCPSCKDETKGSTRTVQLCPEGKRLADSYLRLLRQEPKRRAQREAFARERQRFDRQYT